MNPASRLLENSGNKSARPGQSLASVGKAALPTLRFRLCFRRMALFARAGEQVRWAIIFVFNFCAGHGFQYDTIPLVLAALAARSVCAHRLRHVRRLKLTPKLDGRTALQNAKAELDSGNFAGAVKAYEALEAKFPFGRYAQQSIWTSPTPTTWTTKPPRPWPRQTSS